MASDEVTKRVEYKDSVEQLRDALNLARNAGTSLAIVPTVALDTALMWVDAYSSMMESQREAHDQHTADLRADLQEAKTMNLEYEESWKAVFHALMGKPFENPRELATIQIADALRAERDGLRAEVEALRARVALLEGWNVGTEPPPPFVGSGSDDCEILIHASGFYRHPTESYEYNEWVKHGGDIVDVAFWRYTKKAQERLSDPEASLLELRQKPESEW